MRKIVDFSIYAAALGFRWLFSHLPRSAFFFLAPGIARALFLIPQLGRVSMQNLRAAFPEKSEAERKRIALRSLENLCLTAFEFLWASGKSNVTARLVECTDETKETARKGHESGQGSVFLTPHLGNWEFAGQTLALDLGFQLGVVVRKPRNLYLNRLIASGRLVQGVRIIYSSGAVRACVRALKDGLSIGILIDQNTRVRDGGRFVPFFGLPVPVSMTAAHLARKDDRFVALGTTVRKGRGFIGILKPLPKPAREYASDEELTAEIMRISESLIREHPDQYLWMYKRFQHIPPDADDSLKSRYPAYASVPPAKFFSSKAKYDALSGDAGRREPLSREPSVGTPQE